MPRHVFREWRWPRVLAIFIVLALAVGAGGFVWWHRDDGGSPTRSSPATPIFKPPLLDEVVRGVVVKPTGPTLPAGTTSPQAAYARLVPPTNSLVGDPFPPGGCVNDILKLSMFAVNVALGSVRAVNGEVPAVLLGRLTPEGTERVTEALKSPAIGCIAGDKDVTLTDVVGATGVTYIGQWLNGNSFISYTHYAVSGRYYLKIDLLVEIGQADQAATAVESVQQALYVRCNQVLGTRFGS